MYQPFSVASRLSQLNLGVYYYAHKRGTLESILGYIVLFFFRHSMFPETQNLARSMFSLFSGGGWWWAWVPLLSTGQRMEVMYGAGQASIVNHWMPSKATAAVLKIKDGHQDLCSVLEYSFLLTHLLIDISTSTKWHSYTDNSSKCSHQISCFFVYPTVLSCLGSGKDVHMAHKYPATSTSGMTQPRRDPSGKFYVSLEYTYSILSLWQSVWLSVCHHPWHLQDRSSWYTCF